jgi:hypothetical protein
VAKTFVTPLVWKLWAYAQSAPAAEAGVIENDATRMAGTARETSLILLTRILLTGRRLHQHPDEFSGR